MKYIVIMKVSGISILAKEKAMVKILTMKIMSMKDIGMMISVMDTDGLHGIME